MAKSTISVSLKGTCLLLPYTELEDAHTKFLISYFLHISSRFMVPATLTRITSYNVCYTKLLRIMKRTKNTWCVMQTKEIREHLCVITSYSIHYTKLYEFVIAPTRRALSIARSVAPISTCPHSRRTWKRCWLT